METTVIKVLKILDEYGTLDPSSIKEDLWLYLCIQGVEKVGILRISRV
jgi:hypothetical protein